MKKEYIPQFYLYGKTENDFNDKSIHIETIMDRSEKEFWKIEPHVHRNLFQLIILICGKAEALLDSDRFDVKSESIIIIPSGVVHSFIFSPYAQGYVITLDENSLKYVSNSKSMHYFNHVLKNKNFIKIKDNIKQFSSLKFYFEKLHDEFNSEYSGKFYAMECMAKMILIILYREMEVEKKIHKIQLDGNILSQFLDLVETHYQKQWPVSKYSRSLGVSISTLNRICHKEKGNTAKQLINERLVIEAKRYLIYSYYRIEQVAYELGFDDPAYFSRFFKLKSGVSPKEYRSTHV